MTKTIWIQGALLVTCGVLLGIGVDRGWHKTMLESCYACHKSVGRPYLRPMIPLTPAQSAINFNLKATWPE